MVIQGKMRLILDLPPMSGPPYSRGYVEVYVQHPVTHHTWDNGRYTTYEVTLETNNRAFSLKHSCVRRRFSEFVWLRSQLRSHFPDIQAPVLPPKKFFGGQFDPDVIETRVIGLRAFLQNVCNEPVYLSATVLHLFLQSGLPVDEIVDCMQGRTTQGVLETILQHGRQSGSFLETSSVGTSGYEGSGSFSSVATPIDNDQQGEPEHIFSPTRPLSFGSASSIEGPNDSTANDVTNNNQDSDETQNDNQADSNDESKNAKVVSSTPKRMIHRVHSFDVITRVSSLDMNGARMDYDERSRISTRRRSLDIPRNMHRVSSFDNTRRAIPEDSDSDFGSSESDSSQNIVSILSRNKKKGKRHSVTFSPQVTVAEVIDRLERGPVRIGEVPSQHIAQTMAY